MEQPVCGHCGALFMGPVRSCESCGAPTVLKGEEAKSAKRSLPGGESVVRLEFRRDRHPEEREDEDTSGAGEESSALADDDLEFVDDRAADEDEGEPVPFEDEQTRHSRQEIVEPDTEEIMEKYWDEEEEDRPPARLDAARGKDQPSAASHQPPEAVSDALFLVGDTKEPVKEKRGRVNVRLIMAAVLVIAIAAIIWFIGVPLLISLGDEGPPTRLPGTPGPAPTLTMPITLVPTPAPTTTGSVLLPQKTQAIPGIGQYAFVVRKDPVDARITVIFAGSTGVDGINTADVTVTREDGAVTSAVLMPRKGIPDITLQGSTGTDRVVIIAHMFNGESYRAYDDMVPFR
jgi:hypothetical protein